MANTKHTARKNTRSAPERRWPLRKIDDERRHEDIDSSGSDADGEPGEAVARGRKRRVSSITTSDDESEHNTTNPQGAGTESPHVASGTDAETNASKQSQERRCIALGLVIGMKLVGHCRTMTEKKLRLMEKKLRELNSSIGNVEITYMECKGCGEFGFPELDTSKHRSVVRVDL
jgi:hypothetical protein